MTEENKSSKFDPESEKESLEISGQELHILIFGLLDKLVDLWHEDTGLEPAYVTLSDFIDWASHDLRKDLQDVVVLDSHDLDPSPDLNLEYGRESTPGAGAGEELKPDRGASPELSGAAGLSAYDPNKPRRRRPGKPRGGGFSSR